MRDYRAEGQIGLEKTPEEYIAKLKAVFKEVYRVLKSTGTFWLNIGDTYSGSMQGFGLKERHTDTGFQNVRNGFYASSYQKPPMANIKAMKLPPKCLLMMPERLAFACLNIGFILRNKIIWYKPNSMPSSVKDRFSNCWEYLYFFAKQRKYYFDLDIVRKKYDRPLNRWGGEKLIAKSESLWSEATGQPLYRNRSLRPNPLGKNPGDVITRGAKGEEIEVSGEWLNEVCSTCGRTYRRHFGVQSGRTVFIPCSSKGRNPGDFWTIPTQPFKGAHFAVFPEKLCERPILAGCPAQVCKKCGKPRERTAKSLRDRTKDLTIPVGWTSCSCKGQNENHPGFEPGIVLDPFCGSGTALLVAKKLGRRFIGIDIKPEYCEISKKRLAKIPERLDKFLAKDEI